MRMFKFKLADGGYSGINQYVWIDPVHVIAISPTSSGCAVTAGGNTYHLAHPVEDVRTICETAKTNHNGIVERD